MAVTEFRRLRDRISSLYGDLPGEPKARREQMLADLYLQSHWSQQELADYEHKSQTWVSRHLVFARFIAFLPPEMVASEAIRKMSEGRFRAYWNQTSDEADHERQRFQAVVELLKAPVHRMSNRIAQRLRDDYADGEWRTIVDVADDLGVDRDKLNAAIERIQNSPAPTAPLVERRVDAKRGPTVRISPIGRYVASPEIADALAPIIKKLRRVKSAKEAQAVADELEALVVNWSAGGLAEIKLDPDGVPF
jgi:hypothetical protein